MKNPVRNLLATLLFISIIPIVNSCKKHEVPTLTTSAVSNITGTTATSGGTISDEGSGTVVERGVCWSKGITPTIADNFTLEGGGVGTYVSNMTNLDAATVYYVRSYTKNEAGIGYGMAVSSFWFKDEVGAIYGRGFKLYYNNSPNVLGVTIAVILPDVPLEYPWKVNKRAKMIAKYHSDNIPLYCT